MKTKLLSLFLLIFATLSFAQTTLVEYPFSGDLGPSTVSGALQSTPTLKYFNSAGEEITPNYNNNRLEARNAADYLELSIDTRGFSNIKVSFDAWFAANGLGGGLGSWTLSVNPNSNVSNVYNYVDNVWMLSAWGIQTSRSLETTLNTSADENRYLKLRITSNDFSFISSPRLRLDNLKITAGNPNIKVYTGTASLSQDVPIPNGSDASLALTTDFGTVQTTGPAVVRTFRIRNFNGSANLIINSITSGGNAASDFTPGAVSNSTLSATNSETGGSTTYSTFTVSFLPTTDGLRAGEITINSNAGNYKFKVIGVGASCNLLPTDYLKNSMDTSPQDLESDLKPTDLIGGQVDNSPANSLNAILYPQTSSNAVLSTSPATSWYVRGASGGVEKTVTFGGLSGVDITGKKNVSIQFNVAAYSSQNNNNENNSNAGANINSYVTLSVMKNGGSYVDQIKVTGSHRADRWYRYAFGQPSVTRMYNSSLTAAYSVANTKDTKYGKIILTIPASELVNTLKFKITARAVAPNIFWLIDDVKIAVDNAEFKTWNGISWVGGAPASNQKAVFAGAYTVPSGGLNICECEVNDGVSFTVPSDPSPTTPVRTLTVRGKIVNNGDGDNFVVNNNGNLIQIENAAINEGSITVQKLFTFTPYAPNNRQQYNYVASPVIGGNLKTIYPGNPTTLLHSQASNSFFNSSGYNVTGRALAVQEPGTGAVAGNTVTAKFKGVPFNGILKYPLAYGGSNATVTAGFNLVGNPYSSNIDIESLYEANQSRIEASFWFWDNRGNTQFQQMGSSYTGDNYAKYNAVSGTGVGIGTKAPNSPGTPGRVPSRFVKVGTGFMVRALSTANGDSLIYNNSMRSANNTGPSFFGKGVDKNRYWLSLKTPSEMEFMNAIVYFEGAAVGFGLEDTKTFNSSDAIYSLVDDYKLAINGKPSFENSDKINLGMNVYTAGNYTISLGEKEGVFANGQAIYLKDKQTGTITNLTEGSYTFAAEAGEQTGRFEILYKPETILATDGAVRDELQVYRDGSSFVLRSPQESLDYVQVYDAGGRLILTVKGTRSRELRFDADRMAAGMYILKAGLASGETVTRKIRK